VYVSITVIKMVLTCLDKCPGGNPTVIQSESWYTKNTEYVYCISITIFSILTL
jgi:hypothetical protein